jgi:ubiquinone/menaquinone biosynthesis C-methylase UbiE
MTTQSTDATRGYLPAMGKDWLLPLYDPFTRALGIRAAHRRLADQAGIQAGQRVLEIGCGTGNLALLVKRLHPGATVVGLDPDPKALARAARKAGRAGLPLQLDRGFADALPYPDGSFDRVLSSFMFHHLQAADRRSALAEVRRVLGPGGSLHLLDFGGGQHPGHRPLARLARRSPRMHDNLGDRIPALMAEAGLAEPRETGHRATLIGTYACYRADR